MMDPVQDVSIRYLETDYKFDLANGYLLNKWTGELILITRIDEILSKSGVFKRIEIVFPTKYNAIVLNRFTEQVINHLNKYVEHIEALILVNATAALLKLIGINDNPTKIKHLQVIDSGKMDKRLDKNLPELVQLICSTVQIPLFASINNIRTCYIDATPDYNVIDIDVVNISNACNYLHILDIFDFVERNEELSRFSMTFHSTDLFEAPVDVEGIQSQFMGLRSFEYFIVHDTSSNDIFGYKKQDEAIRTNIIALIPSSNEPENITIEHLDNETVLELSTKIKTRTTIPKRISVMGDWDAILDLFETTSTLNQIPYIILQSGDDKHLINQEGKSTIAELNVDIRFEHALVPIDTHYLTVNYLREDPKLISYILKTIFEQLVDLVFLRLNTSGSFFKLFADHVNLNYIRTKAMANGQIPHDPELSAYLPKLATLVVESNSKDLAHLTVKLLKLDQLKQLSLWNHSINKPLDAAIERFEGHISVNSQILDFIQLPRDVTSLEIFFDANLRNERNAEFLRLHKEQNSSQLEEELQAEQDLHQSEPSQAIKNTSEQSMGKSQRQKILHFIHLKDLETLYITNKWNKMSTTLSESMKHQPRSKYNVILNTIGRMKLDDIVFLEKLNTIDTDMFDHEIYEYYDIILRTLKNLNKLIIRFTMEQSYAADQLLAYLHTLDLENWDFGIHKSQIICKKVIFNISHCNYRCLCAQCNPNTFVHFNPFLFKFRFCGARIR